MHDETEYVTGPDGESVPLVKGRDGSRPTQVDLAYGGEALPGSPMEVLVAACWRLVDNEGFETLFNDELGKHGLQDYTAEALARCRDRMREHRANLARDEREERIRQALSGPVE